MTMFTLQINNSKRKNDFFMRNVYSTFGKYITILEIEEQDVENNTNFGKVKSRVSSRKSQVLSKSNL